LQSTALDLAKDFTALMIISDFDNQFAVFSKQTIARQAAENVDGTYDDLFIVETTTSFYAEGAGDVDLDNNDKANELINEKREKQKPPKKEIKRPQKISITYSNRKENFGCCNLILFSIYRGLKIIFLSAWFYYLPFIFVIYAGFKPVSEYR